MAMTRQDMEVEELRRRVKDLEAEVKTLKEMQKKLIQFVPDEVLGQMVWDVLNKTF